MKCPKCNSENTIKNSPIKTKTDEECPSAQRYKCKECGYQFTKSEYVKQSSKEVRYLALELHYMGLKTKEVIEIFNIHCRSSICNWEKKARQSPYPLVYNSEQLKTEIDSLKVLCENKQKSSYASESKLAKKCLEILKKIKTNNPLDQLSRRIMGDRRRF